MTPDSEGPPSTSHTARSGGHGWSRHLLPVILLAGGGIGFWWLAGGVNETRTDGASGEAAASRQLETLAQELHRQDFRLLVDAQGIVEAENLVKLTSEVQGRVKMVHRCFERGAFFAADEVLLELDATDHQLDLLKARAHLAEAELKLEQARMRSKQAQMEWDDLGYDEEPTELILLKPQLRLAERSFEVAEEEVATALRNIERTKIRAPFAGRVLSREVGVGQTVRAQEELGEVFASDHSEVRLAISAKSAADLDLPENNDQEPLSCSLESALAGQDETTWDARIVRTEGTLDERTLEVFAIARIDDPFGLESGKKPLRIGEPVRARIPGRVLQRVFVVPRTALVGLDRIRIIDAESGALGTVTITPLWSDRERLAFRDESIKEGTMLVLSRLAYAPDGAQVKVVEGDAGAGTGNAQKGTLE